MTATSTKRARLLRLRTIEHRIAKQRLADADNMLANLATIAIRLDRLRQGLSLETGQTSGMQLNTMAEMSMRLEKARAGMRSPMSEAERNRSEVHARQIDAHRREDGAAKLYAKAEASEVVLNERRTDANRLFVKRGFLCGKLT